MKLTSTAGLAVSGATPAGLQAHEQSVHEMLCLVDDPLASAERALAASPEMPMAHATKAWLYLLGTEPAGVAVARASCVAAAALPADARERAHLAAAAALADGRWREAGQRLEDLSLEHPRDVLALFVGHQIDFFRGDSRLLRDRVARALPAWDATLPGYHAVLAMQAFGLEETGDYEGAESAGRYAVELQPRNGWAWHAVAHVHEMRNHPQAGIDWLQPNMAHWGAGSFFAVHNHWHLALFHLERDDTAEVLAAYDRAIGGPGSALVLEMVDASAMLWRLMLRGVDVGPRWAALAKRWRAHAGSAFYAFSDWHAMMAFVGADDAAAQHTLLEAQRAAMEGEGDNAAFTRDVGHPAARAFQAFGRGDFATAATLLRSIRSIAHRFGGSHAQRDLLDLTLIEAALRGGGQALARGLAAERAALRPRSPLAQRFLQRAGALREAPQPA